LDDPTYFPDTGVTRIGSDTSPIVGYLRQQDALVIVKDGSSVDSGVFIRTAEITTDNKAIFPVKAGVAGIGAVSKYAFANLRDDPLFLSHEGVFAIVSRDVTQQRSAEERSFFVNAKLTKEPDLNEAAAVVWKSYYLLAVNGNCFAADGRQKAVTGSGEQFGYEWYFWTNIPAMVFLEHDGELYFGTADGRICKFNTDIEGTERFNDDGSAIFASWCTKTEDFGAFTRRKTLVKRGCGLLIKPYTRSSVQIYAASQDGAERMIRSGTMDLFGFADESGVQAESGGQVKTVPFNTKVKNFILLTLAFKNDTVNEGFGVFGAELMYTMGRYVK
jgi:hypothetical protein